MTIFTQFKVLYNTICNMYKFRRSLEEEYPKYKYTVFILTHCLGLHSPRSAVSQYEHK